MFLLETVRQHDEKMSERRRRGGGLYVPVLRLVSSRYLQLAVHPVP